MKLVNALLLVIAMGAAPAAAEDVAVRGTVTAGGVPQEGVSVEAYLEVKKTPGGTPFAMATTDGEGRFELGLPPGSYFLWARGKAPAFGPPLVTEYPANPVAVTAGAPTVLPPFALREAGRASGPVAPKETGIRGRVTAEGTPAADAAVMIYDAGVARLMGPGYAASVTTGPDGTFQADLPPGSYRVAARKRRDGSAAGFLRPGDLSGERPTPVAVASGKYADAGDLQLHGVDAGRLAERARGGASSPTRLAGTVTGPDGKPLAGQHVFVYRDQGMIGRPEMMAVTREDGSFTFDLPDGGTWYLGARSTMGGPRQPGEMAGRLTGSPASSVTVRTGEARGELVIRMESVW